MHSLRQWAALRKTRLIGLRCLGCVVVGVLLTQTGNLGWGIQEGSRQRPDSSQTSSDRLVGLILDEDLPESARLAAYLDLQSADPEDRRAGLRAVLRLGRSEYAMRAAMTVLAMEDGGHEFLELIVQQMPTWLDGHRMAILHPQFVGKGSKRLRFIARGVLESEIVREAGSGAPSDVVISSVELATRILAFANDPRDRTLLQRTVHARPSSHGPWLALRRRGPLRSEEAALARTIMMDRSSPYLARVAAAGAIAQEDVEAARFALTEVRAYLREFGLRDMSSSVLVKIAGERRISGKLLEESKRYALRAPVLGNLLNIGTVEAEQLTFQFLLAPDALIRRALGVVASTRWPRRFLNETDPQTYPNHGSNGYDMLLALIVYLHPSLKDDVVARADETTIDGLKDRIRRGLLPWWCAEVGGFVMAGDREKR